MVAVAVADKRGLKRICLGCSARFYDFNKRPVVCPGCGAEYTADMKLRNRRPRPAVVEEDDEPIVNQVEATEAKEEDDIEVIEAESDTVSLDEVDEDSDEDIDDEEAEGDLELDDEEEEELDDEEEE